MAKDNTVYIRRNKDRQSETHPEFRGSGVVGGVEFWANAWVNKGDDGEKYFSISLKPKEQARPKPAPASKSDDDPFGDSEIPF